MKKNSTNIFFQPLQFQQIAVVVLFLLVFSAGTMLYLYNLENIKGRSPDEKVYTFQANKVLDEGHQGIKTLVDSYNNNQKLWIYPPPTRVGYLWMLAFLMKIEGYTGAETGAHLSCFFNILSLLIIIVMGLRFFNKWIALYALTFISVSPLALALGRRAWQDAVIGGLGFLMVYFCCEITRSPRKLIWDILLVLTGSCIILIKESGAVIYAMCIAWILWVLLFRERLFLRTMAFAGLNFIGIGLSLFYLSWTAGGVSALVEVLKHVKEAMPTNTYAVIYQTCPWYKFPEAFWITSPANVLLWLVGTGSAFFMPTQQENKTVILKIIIFSIVFFTITAITPYCQNPRYASVIYGPFYLISGFGIWQIFSYLRKRFGKIPFYIVTSLLVISVVIGAVNDYLRFQKLFIRTGVRDTSVKLLKEAVSRNK